MLFSHVLDLLFPRSSLTGVQGAWITEGEVRRLRSFPLVEEGRSLREQGLKHIDSIKAASSYRHCPLLKTAVHTFKYRRIPTLGEALGLLIAEAPFAQYSPSGAVLCPVPLFWAREFHRGFNQAERIAMVVSNATGLSVQPLLRRVRPTGHQAHRKREGRLTAMQGAFRCVSSKPPRHVILIDDLATTGATVDECAKALKDVGVERVEAWVVARG